MKFLDSWMGVLRTTVFLVFCAFLALGLVWGLFEILERQKLVNCIQIEKDRIWLNFKDGQRFVSQLVPSTQAVNDTQIKLENNKLITILTQGSVFTGMGTDILGMRKWTEDKKGIKGLHRPPGFPEGYRWSDDLWFFLVLFKKNLDVRIGWRDADGNLIHNVNSRTVEFTNRDFQKHSDDLRVLPNEEYGKLLGVIADNGAQVETYLRQEPETRKNLFFPIGKSATVRTGSNGELTINGKAGPEYGDKSHLFLLVNDCVVRNEETFYQGSDELLRASQTIEKLIYEKLPFVDLWYLDNEGSFLSTFVITDNPDA